MILPLEKQVCSLELSKQLKKLGFEQDSLWYYTADGKSLSNSDIYHEQWDKKLCGFTSAYTVAELISILKKHRTSIKIETYDFDEFGVKVYPLDYTVGKHLEDVLAKMLIYLLENKLMEVG